jgi:hypothetical protein
MARALLDPRLDPKTSGRASTTAAIRTLVDQMTVATPLWGAGARWRSCGRTLTSERGDCLRPPRLVNLAMAAYRP